MKRIVILLLAMCSFTLSYSQLLTEAEKEITEKTKDDAYLALPKKLVNKKWYNGVDYLIFNSNGTGTSVYEGINKYFSDPVRIITKMPFRWKRNGNVITTSVISSQITATPVEADFAKLSARVKYQFKKELANNLHIIRQKEIGDRFDIVKLTDDVLACVNGFNYDYYVTEKKLNEWRNRQKKIEDAQKKAVEEAKKKADADDLNEKAYEQAREEKYADAIATIDKAIQLCPKDPNYYDSKGEILLNMGDKDGAKAMWDKVVSLDPKFSENKSSLYLMLFEPTDIDFDSELNIFEEIGGKIIKRKNGDLGVSISDEELDKYKEITKKISDNSKYLTLKQQKRVLDVTNKLK